MSPITRPAVTGPAPKTRAVRLVPAAWTAAASCLLTRTTSHSGPGPQHALREASTWRTRETCGMSGPPLPVGGGRCLVAAGG